MSERKSRAPMFARLTFLGAAVLSLLAITSCTKEPAKSEGGLQWLTSYADAIQTAQKKDVPIMIDFYADWCHWCTRLDSDTYSDATVVAKADEFVSLRIDADVERGLSSKYRIGGLPTILFIDHMGREIHRVVGYQTPDKFLKEMERALTNFRGGTGA